MTSIGGGAFNGCSGLTSIVVESGNNKYDSRNNCNAIIETSSNKLIVGCKYTFIPTSVTSIEPHTFDGCSGLTSVTIPNSVKSIGQSAFQNCPGLTSVTIPNSVTSIGDYAFDGCDNLSFVKLGNKISSIGNLAFGYCSNLSSVSLPNSVKSIGEGAFYWCTKFTSITIPRNVISIGWAAFDGCNMATVISEITEPFAISTDTFSNNTYYNATLKVPIGTVEKYKAADGWNKFSFIEENTTAVEYLKSDRDVSKNSHIYNLNGLRLEIPRKGINIINSKIVVLK